MKVKVATRLEPDLQQRLKVHAAMVGRTIEDVVSEAIDGYLSRALLTPVDDGQWAVAVAQRQAQALAANYGDVDVSSTETGEGGGE
jgi:predicted DNA-binding protein